MIAGLKELGEELILLLILLNYHYFYSYYSFSVKIGEMISHCTRDLTILGVLKVYWPKQPYDCDYKLSLGISWLPRLVKIGSLKVRYTLYQQSINYHFCDRLNFLEGCKISDLTWRMLITFLFLFHCLLIVHQLVRKYHDSDCNKELFVSLCLLSNIMITNKIIVLIKNKIIIITHHYFFESTR